MFTKESLSKPNFLGHKSKAPRNGMTKGTKKLSKSTFALLWRKDQSSRTRD